MYDIRQAEQAIKENLDTLLREFNKVLDKHGLSGLKVIGFDCKIKENSESSGVAIIQEFNEILKINHLNELHIISFTLTEDKIEIIGLDCEFIIVNGKIEVHCK